MAAISHRANVLTIALVSDLDERLEGIPAGRDLMMLNITGTADASPISRWHGWRAASRRARTVDERADMGLLRPT